MRSEAKESPQIRRYRRKIAEQLEHEHKIMNQGALVKTKQALQQWLSRHESDRISLEDKSITLFDENRHPEPPHSKFVKTLFDKIRTGAPLSFEQEEEPKQTKE